jgi:NADH:ubiquinone oxidoreductase subunit 6 (subunit J)
VPVLLIGALPQPITEAPLVILIYAVLVLMVASAAASVLLRNTLYAIGAFTTTTLLVAILYLTIAPFLLFAVQLLIFTTVSVVLLVGLLRETTGFERATVGPFSREWIIGGAVAAALLALVGVVAAATSWPIREGPQGIVCCPPFLSTVTDGYRVALATVAILIGSAALGSGLLLASSRHAVTRRQGKRR